MLFNSTTFLIFFPIVYLLYLLLHRRLKLQNLLLLLASYIFYGNWNWRFLILLWISTIVDFLIGWLLGRTDDSTTSGKTKRKLYLIISIFVGLSLLGFFKYFNFFSESFIEFLRLFGFEADPFTLNIILPVGISFYTFQTMSYTIDVYRKRIEPTTNLLNFAVFVAFFPQLVAGPIERAKNLIPQIETPRILQSNQIAAGLYLIIWGYFKKVVVADNLGQIADQIFNNYTNYQGLDIILGLIAFAFQIYGDFSGYSDIARGLSRLMGFELMVNFRLPYFALNPVDFWQRWHISLSSWLRDYLYIPLGGNRKGNLNIYRNLAITMLLGGLWHGAAWNFVMWGGYHGLILILFRIFERRKIHLDPWGGKYSPFLIIFRLFLMFILTLVGWLFFRADSVQQISYMLGNLSFLSSPETFEFARMILFFTIPLIAIQIYQYITGDLLILLKARVPVQLFLYGWMLLWVIIFGVRESTEFIYFQF
jgi:alginate O-acetyltransferase complex protein AlgI